MAYASQNWTKNLIGQTLKAAQEQGLIGGGGENPGGGGSAGGEAGSILLKTMPTLNKIYSYSTYSTTTSSFTYTAEKDCCVCLVVLTGNANSSGNSYSRNIVTSSDGEKVTEIDESFNITYGASAHIELYNLKEGQVINSSAQMSSGNSYCELSHSLYLLTNVKSVKSSVKMFCNHISNNNSLNEEYAITDNGYACIFGFSMYGNGSTTGVWHNTSGGITCSSIEYTPVVTSGYRTTNYAEVHRTSKNNTFSASQTNKDASNSRHVMIGIYLKDEDITTEPDDLIHILKDAEADQTYINFNNYSTEERIIGTWVNNKPLYEKTLIYSNVALSNNTELPVDIEDIEMGFVYGGINDVNDIIYATLPTFSGGVSGTNTYLWNFNYHKQHNTIFIRTSDSYAAAPTRKFYVILRYTKTTDEANIPQENILKKYSTTEKIIGTWIDGKALYEKVIVGTNEIGAGKSSMLSPDITNLDKIISMEGVAYAGNAIQPLPYTHSDSKYNVGMFYANNNINFRCGSSASTSTEIYITIRYTKN